MNTFELKISTPDGNVFEGEATGISVRGIEGDLKILAGHTPFVTSLKQGRVKIDLPDGGIKLGSAAGGLLTVSGNVVTLLSGSFKME